MPLVLICGLRLNQTKAKVIELMPALPQRGGGGCKNELMLENPVNNQKCFSSWLLCGIDPRIHECSVDE